MIVLVEPEALVVFWQVMGETKIMAAEPAYGRDLPEVLPAKTAEGHYV